MYSGAQISLYPLSDGFVDIILGAVHSLDPYRDRLRIETDDLSTLFVGPPELVMDASRDLFVAAARSGVHCTQSALYSRGCPGETDDPICLGGVLDGPMPPLEERRARGLAAIQAAPETGQPVAAQFAYYPLGGGQHMDEIYGVIDFLKDAGTFDGAKNFCTRLRGDAGKVFATLGQAFIGFAPPGAHVTLDVTFSANSPSQTG